MIEVKKVHSQYIGELQKYMIVVERTDTAQKYAGFVDHPNSDGVIQEVAKTGFKPEFIRDFLNESLD